MDIPLFQVDAFTSRVFEGNPAAVCPLEKWLDDQCLQAIAAENNLSETAFFVRTKDVVEIRWFTPLVEIDLCGHATLAAAHVLFNECSWGADRIVFSSRSGMLAATRSGDRIELDFPVQQPTALESASCVASALGIMPESMLCFAPSGTAPIWIALLPSGEDVQELQPGFQEIALLDCCALAVTAPAVDYDFVSRFFAPALGIPEDPVTGSLHCILAPYWADRLGRTVMRARQASARGGELYITLQGSRVLLAGNAVRYLAGTITI